MLFPDERIGRDRKKIVPIFRRERAKLDEFAFQIWLKMKVQRSEVEVCFGGRIAVTAVRLL